MSSKATWWWLGGIVIGSAAATWAVLEFAQRHPESQLAHWFRRFGLLASPQSKNWRQLPTSIPAPVDLAGHYILPTHPKVTLPPDILDQSLRELKLLDTTALTASELPSRDQIVASSDQDEFAPEKIPVPPRLVQTGSPQVVPLDIRSSGHSGSDETNAAPPQSSEEAVIPEDLDDETSQPAPVDQGQQHQECNQPSCNIDHDCVCPANGYVAGLCDLTTPLDSWAGFVRQWIGHFCKCGAGGYTTGHSHSKTKSLTPSRAPSHQKSNARSKARSDTYEHPRGAVPKPEGAAACPCPCQMSEKSALAFVCRVYPVAHLIETHEQGQELEQVINEAVAPGTWQKSSGCAVAAWPQGACTDDVRPATASTSKRGYVKYVSGPRCLVVVHTAQVQREVAELLRQMRRAACSPIPAYGSATESVPSPPPEAEHVLVVPIIRPVFIPVAIPIPVGMPEQELPPPQFRVPPGMPHEEDETPTLPHRPFAPPKTPEKLPDCQPKFVLPADWLEHFSEWWRGTIPQLPLRAPAFPNCPAPPHTLPIVPSHDPQHKPDHSDGKIPEADDSDDWEDYQPLETDLSPPVG
ncbi:MAG: hypothetical protein RMI91_07375 [Gemmatales bacterium]|nr:hypothetical protein [Gemmatales bacterium]MDW7994460.1 hypothetical protein [Gemmatales bacterium]